MKLTVRLSTHSHDGIKSIGNTMDQTPGGVLGYTSGIDTVFDRVTKKENMDGATDYRCLYISNESTGVTIFNPKIKILTTSASKISIGTLGKGVTAQAIATEKSAPSGVLFKTKEEIDATSDGYIDFAGVTELRPGESAPFWIRRQVVSTSGSGVTTEEFIFKLKYTS